MSNGVEIDPFDATGSILRGLPAGDIRDRVAYNLQQPVNVQDFLDMITVQAHVSTTITGALVALRRKNDAEIDANVLRLIEQLEALSIKIGQLTGRFLMGIDKDEADRQLQAGDDE